MKRPLDMRSTDAWLAQVLSQYVHRLPTSRSKYSAITPVFPLATVATRVNVPAS